MWSLERSIAVGGVSVLLAACGEESLAPPIPDCLNSICARTAATASPQAINRPPAPVDAGSNVVVLDGGIVQVTIPDAGAGPGIGTSTGQGTAAGSIGSASELGPVCPVTAPTNGAPCDAITNSQGCTFSRVTCFCTGTWICF